MSKLENVEGKFFIDFQTLKKHESGMFVGTQRTWPARAFTLGHLTHNDLAS